MAIDRMKRVTVLCPIQSAQRLNEVLHNLGTVELVDALQTHQDTSGTLAREQNSTEEADVSLQKIHVIQSLISMVSPETQSFLEGLTPLPLVIEPAELDAAVKSFDLDGTYATAHELDDCLKRAERRMSEILSQIEGLASLEEVPISVSDLRSPKRVRLLFGTIPTRRLEGFGRNPEAQQLMAWDLVVPGVALRKDSPDPGGARGRALATKNESTRIVAAFLPEDEPAVRKILSEEQFEEITLPDIAGKARDRIRELNGDYAECEAQVNKVREEAEKLVRYRRQLKVLEAYWESVRARLAARNCTVDGRWVHVVEGYTRERDASRLDETLRRELPETSLVIRDPEPGDNVPVSITLPPLFRPIQMLINLFGLPPYTAFDPSPFIIINFTLFFGICFGDVGYGLLLILMGGYTMAKTRAYEGVFQFAKLLLYAGISTVIFGMLFGSWFGDLYNPNYLGEGNLLLRIKDSLMVLDPLAQPVMMLVVALVVGVVNQFYGIALKMFSAIRHGDWVAGICDGLMWLITLPGLVIVISTVFAEVPPAVFRLGVAMFGLGAIGLILTQGRGAKGIVARLGTGVVSLYGIMGSYGCAAFVGDTLSYCRLLALALTTSIVGMTVNMIAGLLSEIPVVGIVLFVVVLVIGHAFNFAISMLGAFVHSMRLIFVEFFGRFYEGGAKPFEPMGFDSPAYLLKRPQ